MSLETQAQRFIETLKELGGSAGNGRLSNELGWADRTYQRVKTHLIEEGRIVPGRGRGGSVALANTYAPAASAKPIGGQRGHPQFRTTKGRDNGTATIPAFSYVPTKRQLGQPQFCFPVTLSVSRHAFLCPDFGRELHGNCGGRQLVQQLGQPQFRNSGFFLRPDETISYRHRRRGG